VTAARRGVEALSRAGGERARGPVGVQAVDRALRLLEAIAAAPEPVGVNELARRAGLHRATASRLVLALAAHGFVTQERATQRYTVGPAFIQMSTLSVARLRLHERTHEVLARLAVRCGETVTLSVRDGRHALTVDQVTPEKLVVNMNWIGMRTPLHCSSDGKVLLAWLDPATRALLLADSLERRTARTVTDRARLEEQLARVREEGCAFADEELEEGLTGVAAPVMDGEGGVLAAVSVSGPTYRMGPRRCRTCAELAREAAAEISDMVQAHGGRPSPLGVRAPSGAATEIRH
jgi:DNA-binding IclR family transcriptional regulator